MHVFTQTEPVWSIIQSRNMDDTKVDVEVIDTIKDEHFTQTAQTYLKQCLFAAKICGCNIHKSSGPVTRCERILQIYSLILVLLHWFNALRLILLFQRSETYGSDLFQKIIVFQLNMLGAIFTLYSFIKWHYIIDFLDAYNKYDGNHIQIVASKLQKVSYFITVAVFSTIFIVLPTCIYGILTYIDTEAIILLSVPWTSPTLLYYIILLLFTLSVTLESVNVTFCVAFYCVLGYIIYKEFDYLNKDIKSDTYDRQTNMINIGKYILQHHELCNLIQIADKLFSGKLIISF